MLQNLRSINQTGIKTLIKERLENPRKYVNTPLIIWRANYYDGIQKRILEEAFDEYYATIPREDRKWYRATMLPGGSQDSCDFTTPYVMRDVNRPALGCYNLGLLVIDPLNATRDYKAGSLDKYYSAINNRKVGDVALIPDVPVIAFMCYNYDWFETPEKYPDAEQYIFQPNFDEWAEWAVKKEEFPQQIIDFIRGDGEKEGITYRWYNWYNYFNTPHEEGIICAGCGHPRYWNELGNDLKDKVEDAKVNSIYDLSEEELKEVIMWQSHISGEVKGEFFKYLTKNKV